MKNKQKIGALAKLRHKESVSSYFLVTLPVDKFSPASQAAFGEKEWEREGRGNVRRTGRTWGWRWKAENNGNEREKKGKERKGLKRICLLFLLPAWSTAAGSGPGHTFSENSSYNATVVISGSIRSGQLTIDDTDAYLQHVLSWFLVVFANPDIEEGGQTECVRSFQLALEVERRLVEVSCSRRLAFAATAAQRRRPAAAEHIRQEVGQRLASEAIHRFVGVHARLEVRRRFAFSRRVAHALRSRRRLWIMFSILYRVAQNKPPTIELWVNRRLLDRINSCQWD